MADFNQGAVEDARYVHNTFVVSDLLYAAYRKAHALLHPGQGITNSESAEGLAVLNAMIDGWKIENLLIVYMRRTQFGVVASQKIYAVGPNGDFSIERPEHIPRASFLINPGLTSESEQPMEIIRTDGEWQAFVVKNVGCPIPLALYYQASFPMGTAQIWPVPNVGSQIVLYTPQTLSEFRTVDDAVDMPNGYREMLEYNLAVAIHELYPNKPMAPSVERKAAEYRQRVKYNQAVPLYIGSDIAVMQESRSTGWPAGNPRAWVPPYFR